MPRLVMEVVDAVGVVTLAMMGIVTAIAKRTYREGFQQRLPFWIKSATLTARRSLSIFPYEQTSAAPVGMSERCQFQINSSSSHLVGVYSGKCFAIAPDDA